MEDETASDELPVNHVTSGAVVNTSDHEIEMMDVAGHNESGVCDNDPLLGLNHGGREHRDPGKLCFLSKIL